MILFTDFSVTSLLDSYLTRVHSLVCLVEGFMFIFFLLCRIIIQQIELLQLFFCKTSCGLICPRYTKTSLMYDMLLTLKLAPFYLRYTLIKQSWYTISMIFAWLSAIILFMEFRQCSSEHAPTALLVCYYWIQNKIGNSSQFIICQHRINIQINVNVYMTKAQTR